MMRSLVVICGVLLSVLPNLGAHAHHAFSAEFDAETPVVVRGRVSKVEWINPHAWIHVTAAQENGQAAVQWMFEAGTPNTLARSGLNRFVIPVGTEVIVRGYKSKDPGCQPACKANGRDLMLADGTRLFVGSSSTGAPRDGLDPAER
jgi:hypothetical protein